MCLDFAVMPGFQLFQSLASGIMEYIIHGTGRKLKLLAGFNGLLAGKLGLQSIKEFTFANPGKRKKNEN